MQRYENTEENEVAGTQISYEPDSNLKWESLHCRLRWVLTNWMRTNGVGVHTKQRDSDKRSITPQAQYSVTQVQRSLVVISVALVEVNIYSNLSATKSLVATFQTHGSATL